MIRALVCLAVMLAANVGFAGTAQPQRLSPQKFEPGQWVSYSMTQKGRDEAVKKMQLRYSIVGEEKWEGQECLWHEMQLVRSKNDQTVYRLLIPDTPEAAAETMLCFLSLLPNIGSAVRYIIWEPGVPPTEANMQVIRTVNEDLRRKGQRPGFAQNEPIKSLGEMKLRKKRQVVKSGKSRYLCDLFSASFKSGSGLRSWEYEAFRSAKVPIFGLAKVLYKKKQFGKVIKTQLVISSFGLSGARSVVPGKPVKADMRIGTGAGRPDTK